jgi:hypothetical protein
VPDYKQQAAYATSSYGSTRDAVHPFWHTTQQHHQLAYGQLAAGDLNNNSNSGRVILNYVEFDKLVHEMFDNKTISTLPIC